MRPAYVSEATPAWETFEYLLPGEGTPEETVSQARLALQYVAAQLGYDMLSGSLEQMVERFALRRGWHLDMSTGASSILSNKGAFTIEDIRVFRQFVLDMQMILGRTEVEGTFEVAKRAFWSDTPEIRAWAVEIFRSAREGTPCSF